ncbi:MAG: CoA pyrophosphatase [Myxococcota bacterium]|nr:CoA pyrophosphatase [Myxococcota bacterium]MDW8362883.1 CoA pyrophosphatase [Myxococcales bacterium]
MGALRSSLGEPRGGAAVAAILRGGTQGPEVLLIRRAHVVGDPWSGQMAFPGGRREPDDPDLLTTVLRETREEVGLDLAHDAELLGRLDDTPTHRPGLVVTPYVFALARSVTVRPSPREVAEALWQPLAPLAAGHRDTTYRYVDPRGSFDLPAFDLEGRIVWGLTYRMLGLLFEAVRRSPGQGPGKSGAIGARESNGG